MDNLLNELHARIKQSAFNDPAAQGHFKYSRRGKGRHQLFGFQFENGIRHELSFYDTREPAIAFTEDNVLNQKHVLHVCGNQQWVTSQSIDYMQVVALRDILLALVPMNIVISFYNVVRNGYNLTGYMVHDDYLVRVEFNIRFSAVSSMRATLSRMALQESLKQHQTAQANEVAADKGVAVGTIAHTSLGRSAMFDKPAATAEPLRRGEEPLILASAAGHLGGCAIAPTMGIGLEGGDVAALAEVAPEVAKKVELPSMMFVQHDISILGVKHYLG